MTEYSGKKSLDAEIFIDLKENTILMDYSLNEKGDPMESSTSVTVKDDFKNAEFILKLKRTLAGIYFVLYTAIMAPTMTYLTEKGILKNKQWGIQHQKINRVLSEAAFGKIVYKKEGPLSENNLIVWLPHNMWLQYSLEGEYKAECIAISFTRHLKKRIVADKYEQIKQDGWDLTFSFNKQPQQGSCTVEYL